MTYLEENEKSRALDDAAPQVFRKRILIFVMQRFGF